MSYATVTYPMLYTNDGSAIGDQVSVIIESGGTPVAGASGGMLTLSLAGGTGTNVSGISRFSQGGAAVQVVDGEILYNAAAPSVGSGSSYARGGPVCRFTETSGDANGYILREVAANDSSAWQLDILVDSSPTKINPIAGPFAPPGLSSTYGTQGIAIRWRFIGGAHRIKIWDASLAEPSWMSTTNVFVVNDSSKLTTGSLGFGAGGGANTPVIRCNDITIYQFEKLRCYENSATAATANGGSELLLASTTAFGSNAAPAQLASCSFYAYEPLLIAVAHSKAAAPDSITALTCSDGNVVISARLVELNMDTIAAPTYKVSVYTAMSPVGVSGATFSVVNNNTLQTGHIIGMLRMNGADASLADGSGWIVHANTNGSDTVGTSASLTLSAFTNLIATSGTVAIIGHNGNTDTVAEANWTLAHTGRYTTPSNSLGMEWRTDNDTTPSATWTSNFRWTMWAAEVQIKNAPTDVAVTDTVGVTDAAAARQAQPRSLTDTVGVTDAGTRIARAPRSVTDTAGVTDAVARLFGEPRAVSDSVGCTDSVGVIASGGTKNVTDTCGVTDAVAVHQTQPRALTDTVGVTDAVAAHQTQARANTDTAGVTDAVTVRQADTRGNSDTVSITDAGTVHQVQARAAADTVGVTDSAAVHQTQPRALTDTVAITDALSVRQADTRGNSDTTSVTDAGTIHQGQTRAATDTAGVTDTTSVHQVQPRALTDTVGVTDSAARVSGQSRAVTDTAGITDAAARLQTQPRATTDTVGCTDALSTGGQISVTDSCGITDTAAARQTQARARADSVGVTDSAGRLLSQGRSVVDIAGVTDSLAIILGSHAAVADTVGTSDAVARLLHQPRAAVDSVGVTDRLAAHFQVAVTDIVGVTDVVTVGTPPAVARTFIIATYREQRVVTYTEHTTANVREQRVATTREWGP